MTKTLPRLSASSSPPLSAGKASPPAAAPRLHFIDGLRGLAMLLVLLYHCRMYGGMWRLGPPGINIGAALGEGYIGVNLFLVLSGFCLYWPFTQPGRPEPTLRGFAQKRCRRLLPPYYAALLLFWAGSVLNAAAHPHLHEEAAALRPLFLSLGWHLVLLHNLSPLYVWSINGVFWSLGLEFSLYVLFPVLVEAFRRFGPWLPPLVVLAVDLSWRYAVASAVGPQTSAAESFVLCNSLPGRCFEFAAGMAAAWAVAQAGKRAGEGGCAGRLYLAVSILSGEAAVWTTARFGGGTTFPDALWGLCFAALVVASARPQTLLNRALSLRGLVTLGTFSYSVYLVHLPLTKALDAVVLHFHLPEAVCGVFGIVPLMLLLGYGFHRLAERPFMTPSAPRSA